MYVHFDKDIYLPGETIWFKAYFYNVNQVSVTATNFYVALYNAAGRLLDKKIYPVLAGSTNGDFKIPDTCKDEVLFFRAFTKSMVKEDSLNVYEKIMDVYTGHANTHIDAKQHKKSKIILEPEGGTLVSGMENSIAFRAVDAMGNPAKINGNITEAGRDNILKTFYSDEYGLGKFTIKPLFSKSYVITWNAPNDSSHTDTLPVIMQYGITTQIEFEKDKLFLNITKNKNCDSLNNLHLLIKSGNLEIYKTDIAVPGLLETYTLEFSQNSFPEGIIEFLVFDNDWQLLQQRPVVIAGNQFTNSSIKINCIANPGPDGGNTLELTLLDSIITDLSVSIADYNFFYPATNSSIISKLFFESRLTDFNNTINLFSLNEEKIDLLVRTHQIKKFDWKKLIIKDSAKRRNADNYISVEAGWKNSGGSFKNTEVTNLFLKNKAGGVELVQLKPYSNLLMKNDGLIFFDSVQAFYKMPASGKSSNDFFVRKTEDVIIPDNIPVSDNTGKRAFLNHAKDYTAIEQFRNTGYSRLSNIKTIDEVVVKSKFKNPQQERIAELDRYYTSGLFSGTTKGFQLNLIDDKTGVAAANNLRDYIRFRIPGLELHGNTFGKIQYKESNDLKTVVPVFVPTLVFLNEVRLDPQIDNPFDALQVSEIAYVKYLPGIVLGGSFTSTSGAIYIYTKKENERNVPVKGMTSTYIKGYSMQNDFNYSDVNDKAQTQILHSTLYWNPNVILSKENPSFKTNFQANRVSKKILIKIEGVNSEGKLFHIEKIIEPFQPY